jgi:superfamily II DNA or RNA helicase
MLRDLHFKAVYRSESDSLLDDFYLPALTASLRYDRAVGFFSATMLSYASQGIAALAARGGRMRLIFAGELEADEAEAIDDGYARKKMSNRLGQAYIEAIDNLGDALVYRRLETLSWMIASGLLDIRVALKSRGMYHEKIGILYDDNEDRIVFQGSANETVYALVPDFNFESIMIFKSWRPEHDEFARPFIDGFARLWANESPGTLVIPFPEAAAARMIAVGKRLKAPKADVEQEILRRIREVRDEATLTTTVPLVPIMRWGEPFALRAHQAAALSAWKASGFHGVLSMATGAGKTITALYGITKIFEAFKNLFVIIAVPFQSLADQWMDELTEFGISGVGCYADRSKWETDLTRSVRLYTAGALPFVACVVVNRTLQSEAYLSIIRAIPGERLLLIGDECHNFGASALCKALPQQAKLRLGLSATPIHYFDELRNNRIKDYFGAVCFTYSLKDALSDKVLTPYQYFVHPIELDQDETEEYLELTSKISRLAASSYVGITEDSEDTALNILLFQRARLLGNATGKLDCLRELLRDKRPEPYTLFYCGDGSTEETLGQETTQIDSVSRILYDQGWRVSHFTAEESRKERKRVLDLFRAGALDALVAMKCLDEGIDVPACRTAYILASSRNPRQFVQRRGRILRRSAGKEFAIVHDFLPLLPTTILGEASTLDRNLIVGELKRISEFASLSDNPEEVMESLRPILDRFEALHLLAADSLNFTEE